MLYAGHNCTRTLLVLQDKMLVGTLEHNAMVSNSYKQVPSESGTCSRGLASVDLNATDRESAPGQLTHKCAQHAES